MRNAFKEEVVELGKIHPELVILSGDIGNRMFDQFKELFPDRFYNCGVAEANMISMAAGMASMGLRPICYTITPFLTTRALEQIKLDIGYHEMPVTIVGTGAGLSYSSLGATHHSFEDIGIMRTVPGIQILAPADAKEVKASLRYALSQKEPTYIRIGKKGEPVVYEDIPSFQAGKWDQLNDGKDIALLSTGNMLPSTMEVARLLLENNIAATVINASSIRPLDESLLNNLCDNFPLLATIEEHSIVGGLGSAIAEHLIDKNKRSIQLKRFAMPDRFIHETTDQEYARSLCGLLPHQIKDELTKILNQL